MVPHLTTALTGPLLELERQFLDNACDIERWFRDQWQDHMPPFYGSTDLRNSGFKLAPVDLNLFPGGFNNLNDAFMPLCVQAAQAANELPGMLHQGPPSSGRQRTLDETARVLILRLFHLHSRRRARQGQPDGDGA